MNWISWISLALFVSCTSKIEDFVSLHYDIASLFYDIVMSDRSQSFAMCAASKRRFADHLAAAHKLMDHKKENVSQLHLYHYQCRFLQSLSIVDSYAAAGVAVIVSILRH